MFKKCLPLLLLCATPTFVKPVLTVYTYDPFVTNWGPGPTIGEVFKADYNCELKLVTLRDGVSLLDHLRMEGKNSRAGVVLDLDNNLPEATTQAELFAKNGVADDAVSVPGGWKGGTFVLFDHGYLAFVYDKNRLENPSKSLKELVEGGQKWRIIYQDPRTNTPGLGPLLWMQKVYGGKAPETWQRLASKTITVARGWSGAYGLFLKDESNLALSHTTSPAYHVIADKKDNYIAADFSKDHYLQVEVVTRTTASKQPELAEKFLKFMVSPVFQDAVPTGDWICSATQVILPPGFKQLNKPAAALEFTPQRVAIQRQAWINEWQRAVSR